MARLPITAVVLKGTTNWTRAMAVLQFASLSFDVSLEEILPTLIVGARLVMMGTDVWHPAEFHRKDFGIRTHCAHSSNGLLAGTGSRVGRHPGAGAKHSAQTLHCRRRYDVARWSRSLAAEPR